MTTFKELAVGDTFDFIGDNRSFNSFFRRCEKISERKYRDDTGCEHRVGTTKCTVFHVERREA